MAVTVLHTAAKHEPWAGCHPIHRPCMERHTLESISPLLSKTIEKGLAYHMPCLLSYNSHCWLSDTSIKLLAVCPHVSVIAPFCVSPSGLQTMTSALDPSHEEHLPRVVPLQATSQCSHCNIPSPLATRCLFALHRRTPLAARALELATQVHQWETAMTLASGQAAVALTSSSRMLAWALAAEATGLGRPTPALAQVCWLSDPQQAVGGLCTCRRRTTWAAASRACTQTAIRIAYGVIGAATG